MIRLSKLTDYAVVVLLRLDAGQLERVPLEMVQTSPGVASATGIPEPTVAKVLKQLSQSSLVIATRGARGGYRLARPLETIAISDVISAIDGPIALTACVDGAANSCDVQNVCAVRGRWDLVNDAIQHSLSSITLADMRRASVPPAFRVEAMTLAASAV